MSEQQSSTLDHILAAAKQEFLENGYQTASLRTIAKQANVTTGALYGYFKNKEELFEALVGTQYHTFIQMYRQVLTSFAALPPENQQASMMEYTQHALIEMTAYLYDNYDAFKLLLCCSQGTPYDSLVHELAQLDVDATHDFAAATSQTGLQLKPVNAILEHMLTSGMFATYFELVIHDIPREEAPEYIHQMLTFYSGGWAAIMGF